MEVPTTYKAYVRAKFRGLDRPISMALYGTVPPVVPEMAVDLMAGPRSQKEADQGHLLIWNSHGNLQFVDNPGWKNVEKNWCPKELMTLTLQTSPKSAASQQHGTQTPKHVFEQMVIQ